MTLILFSGFKLCQTALESSTLLVSSTRVKSPADNSCTAFKLSNSFAVARWRRQHCCEPALRFSEPWLPSIGRCRTLSNTPKTFPTLDGIAYQNLVWSKYSAAISAGYSAEFRFQRLSNAAVDPSWRFDYSSNVFVLINELAQR